jgi:hypothetical protein
MSWLMSQLAQKLIEASDPDPTARERLESALAVYQTALGNWDYEIENGGSVRARAWAAGQIYGAGMMLARMVGAGDQELVPSTVQRFCERAGV